MSKLETPASLPTGWKFTNAASTTNPGLQTIKRSRNGTTVTTPKDTSTIALAAADGSEHLMDLAAVDQIVYWACAGIEGVEPNLVIIHCRKSLHNGMKAAEVGPALVKAALPLMKAAVAYSQVCARLLLDSLWGEVNVAFGQQTAHGGDFRFVEYANRFKTTISTGIELCLLPDRLRAYDLDRLAQALRPERDKQFTYPDLRQLYDHQLLQFRGTRFELPQTCFMRMAMVRALDENAAEEQAIEYYYHGTGREAAAEDSPCCFTPAVTQQSGATRDIKLP